MKRILIALISLLALLPAAALGQVVTMDERACRLRLSGQLAGRIAAALRSLRAAAGG